MKYNFDEHFNRKNTDSAKWDTIAHEFGKEGLIGMRIADTDFAAPHSIIQALKDKLDEKVIGYAEASEDVYNNIISFYKKKASWNIKKDSINFSPGIIPILGVSLLALTQEGDEVLTQIPGYPPLAKTVICNNRTVVTSPFIYNAKTGDYSIDWQDLESKITPKTKLFLLCNPHNPTGKVWSREDLERIGLLCLKHNIKIIADEIHGFLNYPSHPYTPMASISEEIANITISCFSPGKLFDIPGTVFAFSVIPNKILRDLYKVRLFGTGAIYALRNALGLTALKASYTLENEEWLEQKIQYIKENADIVDAFLKEKLPKIIPTPNEGTFLKWLNFNALGLEPKLLQEILVQKAGLVFLEGHEFGENGKGFFRMNIGCTKNTLLKALDQLYKAFKHY